MAISQLSARRLIAAGGLAIAMVAAPAVAMFTVPATALADCPNGESADTFTTACVPDLVPNSPLPSVGISGGGGSIPCTGGNSGQCIGLAEEQQSEGPQPVPQSTVGSSPTVTGSIG